MQPFTIDIYEKDNYDMTKIRFWYDDDGTPRAWTVKGLRNGGHDWQGYSDTIESDKYVDYYGDAALAIARHALKSLLSEGK